MDTDPKSVRRILIVEDEEPIRAMLAETLTRDGCQVTCAVHGAEALAALRRGALPGLILLDLMMPVMDGWEFLKQKKFDPAIAAIPVVVMSGIADSVRPALTGAAVSCLAKPVDRQTLCGVTRLHYRAPFSAPSASPPAAVPGSSPPVPPAPPSSPRGSLRRWAARLLRS